MGVYYANTGLNDFLVIETSADILAQALGLLCLLTSILNAMPRHLDAGELMLMRSLHNSKKTPTQRARTPLSLYSATSSKGARGRCVAPSTVKCQHAMDVQTLLPQAPEGKVIGCCLPLPTTLELQLLSKFIVQLTIVSKAIQRKCHAGPKIIAPLDKGRLQNRYIVSATHHLQEKGEVESFS